MGPRRSRVNYICCMCDRTSIPVKLNADGVWTGHQLKGYHAEAPSERSRVGSGGRGEYRQTWENVGATLERVLD